MSIKWKSYHGELSRCVYVRRRPVEHTLEEEGTVGTNPLGGMGFLDGCTIGGGVDGVVFGLDDLSGRHLFVRRWEYREE